MKALGSNLMLMICLTSSQLYSKDSGSTYLIEGTVQFINAVSSPNCKIIILVDGVQHGDEVDVQNVYPYRFRREIIVTSTNPKIRLDVVFINPIGFIIDRNIDLIYHGTPKTIRVRKIEDALSISIDKAKGFITNGFYKKAIDELEYYFRENISLSDAQFFRVTRILAAAYSENEENNKSIETLRRFLNAEIREHDSDKFEILMQLSKIYVAEKLFFEQVNLLESAPAEISFSRINPKRVRTYYFERLCSLQNLCGFNNFKTYPLIQFCDKLCSASNKELLQKWKTFVSSIGKHYKLNIRVVERPRRSDVKLQYESISNHLNS